MVPGDATPAPFLRVPAEPLHVEPGLFTWDAQTGPKEIATGVTRDPNRACARLAEALAGAPVGSTGVVHLSELSVSGGYLPVEEMARAEVTEAGVVWL